MVDASKVRVAITGAVSKGPHGTTAPTGTAGDLAERVDLGGISEDGVALSLPDGGDVNQIKVWQNGQAVRTLRTVSDDLPQLVFTMVETSKETVETYFGVDITQTATEGSFEYKVGLRDPDDYVLDVIDGAELMRFHVPQGVVSSVDSITFANSDAVGWQVTIDCELDTTADYNLKGWATALKSAA